MAEPQKTTNGPFTITESEITDPDGRQWLEMKITVSSECRVPLADPFHRRHAQLKAERMNLHTINEAIVQALEDDEDNAQ